MLKAGVKRRRTTQEINDQKEEEEIRQQSIEEKLARFEKLQQELNQARAEAENGKNATNILTEFINNGDLLQDQHGNVIAKPQINDQSDRSQHS